VKPATFEYVAVSSIREAVTALKRGGQVLAGGQSLVPLLNTREVRPALLVDINPIPSLGVLRRTNGTLHIGATVRQATLERSLLVSRHWPLLTQAVRHVGHPATRSRGTVCGSVAHAEPTAELPLALLALNARYVTSRRMLPTFEEGLQPGEFLTGVVVPPLPPGAKTAFKEYAKTEGVYASAAVAVVLTREQSAIAVTGAGRANDAEHALQEGATAEQAAQLAARKVTDPHQRALVTELTRLALNEAGRA
jgi:CO/xanthine dehydrogenase FAD-binding subunit